MLTNGRLRVGAVLAGAIVVALALWLVLSARKPSGGPSPAAHSATLSEHELIADARRDARRLHTPAYWVGPRPRVGYEFDSTPGGRMYVRYLPKGVKAGDPRPDFLTVGTYKLAHPMADLRRAAHGHGAETVRLPDGAVAFMDRFRPTSVFVVGRRWKAQVEVFDPKPGRAMELVLKGYVRPVR